ncbi:MAG: hypothetical protein MJ033_05395 [Victivallaceae bacterium]|nr:hypothetical protein [Victivallaceae bacterium]
MESFAYGSPQLFVFSSKSNGGECYVDCPTDDLCGTSADELCSGSDEVDLPVTLSATQNATQVDLVFGNFQEGFHTYDLYLSINGGAETWVNKEEGRGTSTSYVLDKYGYDPGIWVFRADVFAGSSEKPVYTPSVSLNTDMRTAITITADSGSKVYDGKALTAGYTFAGVKEGDTVNATVEGSITDAGETANKVTSYKVMRGEVDVTGEYAVTTYDGTLTVTPRQVTLTSGSAQKVYDGTPLTCDTVTVSGAGWAAGEGATYTVTGSQTEVGTSKNEFTYTLADNTKPSNYNITQVAGDLTVLPRTAITISTANAQKAYNGKALTAKKYTVSGKTQKGDKLIVTVTGSITDIGEAQNTATLQVMRGKTDVSNEYDITVVPGTLTVTYGSTYVIDGKEETIDAKFLRQDFKKLTVQNGGVLLGGTASVGAKELVLKSGTVADDPGKINVGKLSVSDAGNVIDGAVAVDSLSVAAGKQVASSLAINGALSFKVKNAKFSAGNDSNLTLQSIEMTSGNDTLTIGKDSVWESDAIEFFGGNDKLTISGGEFTAASLDFGAGNDTLSIGASAKVTIDGDIKDVETLTSSAGKSGNETKLTAGTVTFDTSAKNAKMTFGNNSVVELAYLDMPTMGGSLSIGKDSTFTVDEIIFRESQKNSISVGSNSVVTIKGNKEKSLTGDVVKVSNLTFANGSVGKNGKPQYTQLTASGTLRATGNSAKFTFGNYNKVDVAKVNMTDGNDTLTIGKDSVWESGAINFYSGNDKLTISGGEFTAASLDFGKGNDTLSIGTLAEVKIGEISEDEKFTGGTIADITTLTAASGKIGDGNETELTAGNVAFDDEAKSAKMTFGNYSKVNVGNVTMKKGNDTLSVGKYSVWQSGAIEMGAGNDTLSFGGGTFSAGEIKLGAGNDKLTISGGTFTAASLDFGDGTDTLTIGALAEVTINGDITNVTTLTSASGKIGDGNETELTAGNVAFDDEAKSAKMTFGNYSKVNVGNVTMKKGNDTLSVGKDSVFAAKAITLGAGNDKVTLAGGVFTAERLDLGAGNDTLTFGNDMTARIDDLDFGVGKDTLSVGKNAEVWLGADEIDDGFKMTVGKGAKLHLVDGELYDFVQEKFAKEIKSGSIEVDTDWNDAPEKNQFFAVIK